LEREGRRGKLPGGAPDQGGGGVLFPQGESHYLRQAKHHQDRRVRRGALCGQILQSPPSAQPYRYFRDSKAKRSYENSLRLKALGVDTPDPAGYAEERSVRGLGRSYFVSAYLPFDFEIRALFADPRFPRRDEILEAFVKFAWELHEKGVYHVDFSPGNILVKEEGEGYRFYLVDVNRMRFGPLGAEERMQSLSKLTSSEEDNRTMVALYAGYSGWDEEELLRYHRKALRRQREYLERKRRLKSLFNPLRKRG